MGSLSNLYISQSYQSLIHLATNNTASATLIDLQDGLGNSIGVSVNTGGDLYLSGSLTASLQQGYLLVGGANGKTYSFPTSSLVSNVNTSSLVTTASFNAYTASNDSKVNQLINATSSYAISSSVAAVDASQQSQINSLIAATGSYVTSTITASSLVTASFSGNTLTFTKGDSSTFGVVIPDISGSTINTGSFATTGSNTFTGTNSFSGAIDTIAGISMYQNGLFMGLPKNMGDPFDTNISISTPRIIGQSASGNNLILAGDTMNNKGVTILNSLGVTGSVVISKRQVGMSLTGGDLDVAGTFTASLQQGYVWVGDSTNRTTLVATSSFFTTGSGPTDITSLNAFTASQLNINAGYNQYTSSTNIRLNNLESTSASVNISISNLNASSASQQLQINSLIAATGSYVTSAITASSLVTASVNLNTITFTKGDATTFNITVDTGSAITTDITSLNAFTASQETKDTTLESVTASLQAFTASQQILNGTFTTTASFNSYTQSNDQRVSSLESNSASVNISISNINSATASLFTSASLALVTASFSGNTLTFTKGDTTTFGVVIPDVSGSAGTTIFEVVYTGENITKGDPLYISGSQGANPRVFKADAADPNKMPVTFVSNETIGVSNTTDAIVLGLIEGIDLTGYTAGQAIYVAEGGGLSLNLPSGSNSITQLLGVVTKGGSGGKGLVLNPGPAQLPGLDNGYLWVGNGSNQPIEITTASFASSASFNSYTASNDSKVNSLINATASYATFAITASSLITASVNLNTITFTKGDASTFNITVDTGSGGGGGTISVQDEGTILGNATSFNFNGAGVTATLSAGTASITIPGGGGSIDTGSFATTGSNTFTGDQTFIDAGSNFFTITDRSGSMILVGKSYTSASAHLSSSVPSPSGSQLNLIFKTNNNTADTIISGSNNIFTNPAAPTAGFKRYIGNNNIAISPAFPQISGSMAFSPAINNNYLAATITMRAPVSASLIQTNTNVLIGAINIGTSAILNAEKLTGQTSVTNNFVAGNLNLVANQSEIRNLSNLVQNNINGTVTLNLSSSAVIFPGNTINDGAFTFTNQFSSGGLGFGQVTIQNNTIAGTTNTFIATGSQAVASTQQAAFQQNLIAGNTNTAFVNSSGARVSGTNIYHQLLATSLIGHNLIVTGSSNTNDLASFGSAFVGRFNAVDGIRDKSSDIIFAVGTGTSTSNRKTGFHITSGSNSFFEGILNVSGSSNFNGNVNITGSLLVNGTTLSTVGFATTGSNSFNGNQRITGSLTISGSIITVDRSGNDGNTYMGQNALGMGFAGAQPLAVGNTISVAIGQGAMRFASGSNQNVAIGNNALLNTSGSKNFAMGSEALSANTLGSSNIAIGTSALQNNRTGDSSTAIGDSAAQFASGSQNTFIGQYSGYNVTGSNNVIIGSYRGVAGEVISNNIILSDGQQNIKAQYSGSAWAFQDNIKFNKGTNKTTDIVSVNGSVTVNNSLVTAASIILVTTQNSGTGPVYPAVVLNKGAGTFDIAHNFGSALDVAYMIINPT